MFSVFLKDLHKLARLQSLLRLRVSLQKKLITKVFLDIYIYICFDHHLFSINKFINHPISSLTSLYNFSRFLNFFTTPSLYPVLLMSPCIRLAVYYFSVVEKQYKPRVSTCTRSQSPEYGYQTWSYGVYPSQPHIFTRTRRENKNILIYSLVL